MMLKQKSLLSAIRQTERQVFINTGIGTESGLCRTPRAHKTELDRAAAMFLNMMTTWCSKADGQKDVAHWTFNLYSFYHNGS